MGKIVLTKKDIQMLRQIIVARINEMSDEFIRTDVKSPERMKELEKEIENVESLNRKLC